MQALRHVRMKLISPSSTLGDYLAFLGPRLTSLDVEVPHQKDSCPLDLSCFPKLQVLRWGHGLGQHPPHCGLALEVNPMPFPPPPPPKKTKFPIQVERRRGPICVRQLGVFPVPGRRKKAKDEVMPLPGKARERRRCYATARDG
jgi:hypothetical protein